MAHGLISFLLLWILWPYSMHLKCRDFLRKADEILCVSVASSSLKLVCVSAVERSNDIGYHPFHFTCSESSQCSRPFRPTSSFERWTHKALSWAANNTFLDENMVLIIIFSIKENGKLQGHLVTIMLRLTLMIGVQRQWDWVCCPPRATSSRIPRKLKKKNPIAVCQKVSVYDKLSSRVWPTAKGIQNS